MVEEIILNIVHNIVDSFDIPFCVAVNIATYLCVNLVQDSTKTKCINTWYKRLILVIVSIVIAIIYCINGSDYKVIFNSMILAPVSWSWILKPICAKLKIDYCDKALED